MQHFLAVWLSAQALWIDAAQVATATRHQLANLGIVPGPADIEPLKAVETKIRDYLTVSQLEQARRHGLSMTVEEIVEKFL